MLPPATCCHPSGTHYYTIVLFECTPQALQPLRLCSPCSFPLRRSCHITSLSTLNRRTASHLSPHAMPCVLLPFLPTPQVANKLESNIIRCNTLHILLSFLALRCFTPSQIAKVRM